MTMNDDALKTEGHELDPKWRAPVVSRGSAEVVGEVGMRYPIEGNLLIGELLE